MAIDEYKIIIYIYYKKREQLHPKLLKNTNLRRVIQMVIRILNLNYPQNSITCP